MRKHLDRIKYLKPVKDLWAETADLGPKVLKQRKTLFLDVQNVFNNSGFIFRHLPNYEDRTLLFRRVSSYLRSKRRGKLRLPNHFPREVLALREMRKSQLTNLVFWVKPNTSINHSLPKCVVDHIHRTLPGMIWTSPNNVLRHMANTVGTVRLCRKRWPGDHRQRWPSTPSFSEMLEMSRRGLSTLGLDKSRITVKDCITRRQVSENSRLATKIVSHNIVGIRSSEAVPEKFLDFFRYRHGFLILSVRHCLPIGLVRFLLGQWIRNPFSLWLKENCRFRIFLNRHAPTEFIREAFAEIPAVSTESSSRGMGSPAPPPFNPWLFEDGDEFDQQLAELFDRLP